MANMIEFTATFQMHIDEWANNTGNAMPSRGEAAQILQHYAYDEGQMDGQFLVTSIEVCEGYDLFGFKEPVFRSRRPQ